MISQASKKELIKLLGNKCLSCGKKENLSLDHIKPKKRGGTDDRSNLQVLCLSCNISKGQRIIDFSKGFPNNLKPTRGAELINVYLGSGKKGDMILQALEKLMKERRLLTASRVIQDLILEAVGKKEAAQ